MPNYVPCRTGDDSEAHIYLATHPDKALCGKAVGSGTGSDDGRPVCIECAKRLLIRTLQQAGPGGISSIEVTVHT